MTMEQRENVLYLNFFSCARDRTQNVLVEGKSTMNLYETISQDVNDVYEQRWVAKRNRF